MPIASRARFYYHQELLWRGDLDGFISSQLWHMMTSAKQRASATFLCTLEDSTTLGLPGAGACGSKDNLDLCAIGAGGDEEGTAGTRALTPMLVVSLPRSSTVTRRPNSTRGRSTCR